MAMMADGRWFGGSVSLVEVEGDALWKPESEAPETVPELLDDECLTTSEVTSILTSVQPMVPAGEEDDEVISKASLDAQNKACKEFASKRLADWIKHC